MTGAPPDYHYEVVPEYGPRRMEPRWRKPLKTGKDRNDWWFSVVEVSAAMGMCRKTIYRWIQRGWLRARQAPNGRWFIKGGDLETFVEGQGRIAP